MFILTERCIQFSIDKVSVMTPTNSETSKRAQLRFEYDSMVNFNISDDLCANAVHLDGSLLPIDGLVKMTLDIPSESPHQIHAISVFEFNIREDRPEYQAFKSVIDGEEEDSKFHQFFRNRVDAYEDFLEKLIDYLIWRKKLHVHYTQPRKIETSHCIWTLNGKSKARSATLQYYAIGDPIEIEIPGTDITIDDFSDFKTILNTTNSSKPLYHELLEESVRLLQTRQLRSAYLMLYSAIEVATKNLISYKKPDTDFLINSMASPDLVKLYREYINKTLIINMLSKDSIETLGNMATQRNAIAHQGKIPKLDVIIKHANFVRRLLYDIDAQFGYTWVHQVDESIWSDEAMYSRQK
ncbi:hypothetical protein [Spirosoma flavum]|uniref:Apea-like HEPN domain-containing protein n=1 Tax=Spirosoma flavum TaxID=2048557 RepID=A0ABW6AWE2_9BACT